MVLPPAESCTVVPSVIPDGRQARVHGPDCINSLAENCEVVLINGVLGVIFE